MTLFRYCLYLLIFQSLFLLLPYLTQVQAAEPSTPALLNITERAWLKNHPLITLAPDPDFRPIEYFDDAGNYQGAAADIIRLLEKKLGIQITIVQLENWDEVMAKFQKQEVDMVGAMVRTPEREKFALFSDTIVAVPGGIFTNSSGQKHLSLDDLKGKKVAVVSNYTAHDILRNNHPDINLEIVPDVFSGLAKASLGIVDAYVENMANATYYAREAGLSNLQLSGRTDFIYRWGIGVRRDWPILQTILNKGLAAISEEEREQIIQRYIYIARQKWRPSKLFIAGTVTSFFALLLLVALYWNYSLRKVVLSRTALLQKELGERERAETALKQLTSRLETEVKERTSDLEQEVAEHSKAEAAARANEQKFREVFQNVADPIYISDLSGQIIAANEQACFELGYSHGELLNKRVLDIGTIYDEPEKIDANFKSYSNNSSQTLETEHRRKDGSRFPVEIRACLIEFEGQKAIIGIARNLTARKEAEEEKQNLETQLQQAKKMEAIGQLAGGVAHDFNNMLGVILGHTEIALQRLEPHQPLFDNLQEVNKAAKRSADLTRQLLAFARKQTITPELLDLNESLSGMLTMLERLIGEDIDLAWKPGRDLGSVKIDPSQLDQILTNLCVNARDAIAGSGKITIETDRHVIDESAVSLSPDQIPGKYIRLTVSDDGCGMDKEQQMRLFEPFYTTKSTGKGTGLGMATVYGVIKQNKGFIDVYSKPGQGTSCNIYLPMHRNDNATKAKKDVQGSPLQINKTILLVEDEPMILDMTATMLKLQGYKVFPAVTPMEAIRLAEQHADEIDLLITDVVMPEMNGRELAQKLLADFPKLKSLFMSGYTADVIARHGVLEDGVHFIQKPFDMNDLTMKLREVFDG